MWTRDTGIHRLCMGTDSNPPVQDSVSSSRVSPNFESTGERLFVQQQGSVFSIAAGYFLQFEKKKTTHSKQALQTGYIYILYSFPCFVRMLFTSLPFGLRLLHMSSKQLFTFNPNFLFFVNYLQKSLSVLTQQFMLIKTRQSSSYKNEVIGV